MPVDRDEVISSIVEKYKSCDAYHDKGIAACGNRHISFETCFVRPSLFFMNWQNEEADRKQAIRHDGHETQYLSRGKWKKERSLDYALRIASGASMMTAQFIGHLLMPGVVKTRFSLLDIGPYSSFEIAGSETSVLRKSMSNLHDVSVQLTVNRETMAINACELHLGPGLFEGSESWLLSLQRAELVPSLQIDDEKHEPFHIKIEVKYMETSFNRHPQLSHNYR